MRPELIRLLYKTVLRPALFRQDPEKAHDRAVAFLSRASDSLRKTLSRSLGFRDDRLRMSWGTFSTANPIGLAAGFDKGAELVRMLGALGFGFAELGTFTPVAQAGQEKPRLFRFPREQAVINRMGFNNPGIGVLPERFKRFPVRDIPFGINIGKGKNTPLAEAVADYVAGFETAYPYADYIAVNVSSPNTPGLRDLQARGQLSEIMSELATRNRRRAEEAGLPPKPLFVKVAPDLPDDEIDAIGHLAVEWSCGLIATNTTINHGYLKTPADQSGGLSGAPLRRRADEVLRRLAVVTRNAVPLIGVGGIMNAEDAYRKIRLGARWVQVYTGWIYGGPTFIRDLNKGLIACLERDRLATLQDAVGADVRRGAA